MSTMATSMYEWKTINWKKIQRKVFKLQKRIYQASLRGDVKTVRRLQRLLIKSCSVHFLPKLHLILQFWLFLCKLSVVAFYFFYFGSLCFIFLTKTFLKVSFW